jgi:hypothetical protein
MFSLIWRTVVSAWRRAAKFDVIIDIRLAKVSQSSKDEMVEEAFGKGLGCRPF